jgi:hypothetical protein
MLCTRNALSKVLQRFAAQNPEEMAARSGATFKDDTLILKYCNIPLGITYPGGEAHWLDAEGKARPGGPVHEEKVVILQYLATASGLPARGRWLSFHELRGGQMHWKPFQREALEPLARGYHYRQDTFLELGYQHGGTRLDQGDASVLVPVLPRIELAFILWEGGEEFVPRSTILFDTVVEAYFPTAVSYILAIQAVIRIWFPGDTRFD